MLSYFIFNRVPGQHERYTVAVLAVSRADAKNYMRWVWKGGIYIEKIESGHVKADCGALTAAAEREIRQRRETDEADEA